MSDLDKQLLDAVKSKNLKQVKRAIKQGADVNIQDENGNTPLMIAVKYEYRDDGMGIIKYLVDNDANLDIQNNNGDTALIIAVSSGTKKVYLKQLNILLIKVQIQIYKITTEILH